MKELKLSFKAPLEHINEPGGWWYVRVPKEIRDVLKPLEVRGYTKIIVTVGKTAWETSMMPLGGGIAMIALKAEARKTESLEEGQQISLTIAPLEPL